MIEWRALHDASRDAFTFLADGATVSAPWTYADLDRRARAIGAFLRDRGATDQPVLLCHPPGLDFLGALFGCFYAGALAVPAYPPRNRRHVARIQAIATDCRARLVLTAKGYDDDLRAWLTAGGGPPIEVLCSDEVPLALAGEWRGVARRSDGLAYLQYTSGSTSTPKGVMVTHDNIIANADALRDGFSFERDSVNVTWIPTFHDMGLVFTIFVPLLMGNPLYQMAPASFLQSPVRWLEAIERYGATHSGGPNFAFELCCDRISEERAAMLDLSHWRVALNGSEPLRKSSMDRFSRTFASAGFSPRAHNPGYGLAEVTLAVSSKRGMVEVPSLTIDAAALAQHRVVVSDGGAPAVEIVSSGTPVLDTRIAIVDAVTRRPRGANEIGEIWVDSPGVTLGYWQNPQATAEVFGARTADGDGPYLRTGDFGALIDGELYVTGRLKDVIIVRGRNHYPHDIELTVQQADASVEPHSGAAFGVVLDGEESLVIVQEVKRSALRTFDAGRVLAAIHQAVVAEHEIEVADLLLVAPLECPKTSSGKIQHSECKARYLDEGFKVLARKVVGRSGSRKDSPSPDASVRQWLITRLSELKDVPPREIDPAAAFESFGVDSLTAVRISGELEEAFNVRLAPTVLYEHPTIDALSAHVLAQLGGGGAIAATLMAGKTADEPIAIVGLGCRFPGADDPDAFWQLLRDGVDRVGSIPAERWSGAGHGAFLSGVDEFDAEFFGIAPREATDLDPQQRLLLEVSWTAIEHAGIAPSSLAGSDAGVFVGISTRDYGDVLRDAAAPGPYFGTGTAASAAAGRLSYVLGLEGPSLIVDTACSSSLVAVHLAAQSLRAGECRLALAGAVNLMLSEDLTNALTQARMLSPTGRCRTFSADADGYVRGEGCGVVVLKRLSDARADGDRVLAIVRGTAINQDGRSNGLTAPNGIAQERVVRSALRTANVDATEVGYVEAHGTGTPLGDPIEVNALARVFGARSSDRLPAYLGSVKTNIGHLEAAAGMAGLIKVVLSLQHAQIPPHLHAGRPNAMIAWDAIPFTVPRELAPWPADRARRIAGISSFGFVGTNAHVIVEAGDLASPPDTATPSRGRHALCLSARSENALAAMARAYATTLDDASLDTDDVCFTAATGRAHLRHRIAVTGASNADLRAGLDAFAEQRRARNVFRGERAPGADAGVVFLFTGQGSQYAGMGRALYDAEPVFRRAIDECDELLRPHLDAPLLSVLYPEDVSDARIDRTDFTQPALFAVEWALAELWRSWGVVPAAVIGHSIGEYVAACVAGVFALDDALKLVAARGRAMQAMPAGGAMAAVAADEATVRAAIGGVHATLAIAAVNAPSQCVVSGEASGIEQLAQSLEARGIACERLNVSHAFHSPLVAPAAEEFRAALRGVTMRAPRVPLVSNVTGAIAADELLQPDYWCRHITGAVRFSDGVNTLRERGFTTFLELGPQPTLTALAQQSWTGDGAAWIASMRRRGKGVDTIVDGAAALYAAGIDLDWSAFYAARPHRRVALPTYPFERVRYWPAPATTNDVVAARSVSIEHPALGARLSIAGPDVTWSRRVSVATSAWLTDHRIEDAIVMPGAAFIEAALAAVRAELGSDDFELTPLAFERPLVLSLTDEVELQTRLSRDASGRGSVAFHSRHATAGLRESHSPHPPSAPSPLLGRGEGDLNLTQRQFDDWVQHGTIGFVAADAGDAESVDLDGLRGWSNETIAPADFYGVWGARGNNWGPAFQGIASLRRGRGEAIGEIVLPDAIRAEGARRVHPALLDACVQVLAAAIPERGSGAFVGKSVSSVRVRRQPVDATLWSHATVSDASSGRHVVGDVNVYDGDGEPVIEIRGLRFEFIDRDAPRAVDPDRWLHAVQWTPIALPAAAAIESRHWAVVGTGFAEELVLALEARGQQATIVRGTDTLSQTLRSANIARVLYVALDSNEQHLASLQHVIRAIDAMPAARPRLTILTRGACMLPGDRASEPAGALLWGLARTLSVEHGDVWDRIIDLESGATNDSGSANTVAGALLQDLDEDQLAIRADALFAPRLARVDAPRNGRATFRVDAAYLITGGLGALGLRVARWMAERGARRLILMGRTGLPERSQWRALAPDSVEGRRAAAVRAIEQLGADVRIARVDVADADALTSWLDDYRREDLAPIRGIVHAAGVVREAALTDWTAETLAAQLGAKAGGAATLDRLFGERGVDELDTFVLFSSSSAVLASPRLGAYAAANAFLDALAASRRARGLAGLSVQWGAWAESGMAAEAAATAQLGGMDAIDPERGLATLDRIWSSPLATVAVLPVDWDAWRARYAGVAASPLLRALVGSTTRSDDTDLDADRVRRLPDEERRAELATWLARVVAHVLRLPDTTIDARQPLGTLGLDSLMALEIRNRIQDRLRVSIPLVEVIRGGTLGELLALVEQRLQLGQATAVADVISAGELTAHAWPLSQGQRSQWLLHTLDPDSASYHVAFTARITSALDVDALRRAWRALRERHLTLRMSWQRDGDTVTQSVRTAFADSFESIDAAGLDEDALRAAVTAAYRQPFDLEQGEPARLHVYSRGADEHVLLLVAHHIACDGWSLWLLLNDLKDLYATTSAGGAHTTAELPATYLDFVRAEAGLLAGAEAERQWAYWREELAGNLEVLELPVDRPRAARHVRQGASFPLELPEALTAAVRQLAQANGVTLFTVLAAALNTLLHRYTGQSDVLIGTPTAGRTERRFAGVVGHFINQVVLRTDFSDDPRFDTLLARTGNTILDALANQDVPFAQLVERLRPNRDPNRTPIFDVNFVFQQAQTSAEILGLMNDDGNAIDWGALQLRSYPLHQQEGQFDLTVELLDAGAHLVGDLKYDAALFDRETMARFASHFRNLLHAAARAPEGRVSTLPLLDAAEREALLTPAPSHDFNAVHASLQELFEQQVARTPDAAALSFGEERLSYAELNAHANRLAHRLRALGVGAESLVALRLEPGIDTIVSILGTLKAGGGYLPIDMSYPDDRAAFMIGDSGARVVVDADWLAREADALAAQPSSNPPIASGPENVAYCIYTSGTTGRPKGVLIEHRQVTRLFDATREWFAFGTTDVSTLFHSYAFDFSVWEIWGALLHGGRLVIVPYLTARSPEGFHRLVCDEGVTVLNQTPSAFRELFMSADAAAGGVALPLRAVIFGGEALDSRMLAPWFERHPAQPQMINMYGITETTVHVTYAPVTGPDATGASSIGRAIPDLRTYVLDANLEPVPIGVRGELYVGGAGLARGYLARPELTAERFVPSPFSTTAGARLYRTGDLGRYRSDGTIEYLGRIDRQVKIRGFRIERGEIEAELRRHPLVDEAIVLPRTAGGSTTLAAYAVCTGAQPSADALRLHLREVLPEYMVPSSIVVLERLPLTNNGKLDQAALAALDVQQRRAPAMLAAPATDTERAVAAVWREVLAIDAVGRDDNFFDLGGHSLLVPQVHRRLKERFSSSITIVDLFRYPTVGDLAQFLAGVTATDDTSAGAARAQMRQARRRARP